MSIQTELINCEWIAHLQSCSVGSAVRYECTQGKEMMKWKQFILLHFYLTSPLAGLYSYERKYIIINIWFPGNHSSFILEINILKAKLWISIFKTNLSKLSRFKWYSLNMLENYFCSRKTVEIIPRNCIWSCTCCRYYNNGKFSRCLLDSPFRNDVSYINLCLIDVELVLLNELLWSYYLEFWKDCVPTPYVDHSEVIFIRYAWGNQHFG